MKRLKITEATAKIVAVIGPLFLLGLILIGTILWAHSCYVDYRVRQTQEELNKFSGNTSNANYQSKVAEKDANRAEIEVREKEIKARDALKNLEEIKKKDSSLESTDAQKALERYCSLNNDPHLCK